MLKRSIHLVGIVAALVMLMSVFVGTAAASTPPEKHAYASVSVAILQKSADQDTLVYDVIAENHTDTYARNATITVPFDSAALRLVGVKFSGGPAWVQKQDASTLIFSIERLHQDHPTTATLRFAKLPSAPKEAGLNQRAQVMWTVHGQKGRSQSNMPMAMQPNYPLAITDVSTSEGATKRFGAKLFVPGEPIVFWCNMPSGEIHGLKIRRTDEFYMLQHEVSAREARDHKFINALGADASGTMSIDFPVHSLQPGFYSIVARGQWSGLTAVAPFELK